MNPEDAAAYIADMTANLREIARHKDLDFLVYLLEMVHEEALCHVNILPGGCDGKTG